MLQANDVELTRSNGRRLFGPANLTVTPGTLKALVGPSGSG